ncbi:hypothetical protein D3C76_945550 [compost metagenome]
MLLALALVIAGNLCERLRGLVQAASGLHGLTDHSAQLAGERVEVAAQRGHFIAPATVQVVGQVGFAAGDVLHCVDHLCQWRGNAAGNQQDQRAEHQGDRQQNDEGLYQLAAELDLHVVDVDARAHDPAPGLEQFDVGNLLHRRVGTRLGPAVVHQPGAIAFGRGDHFVEQRLAVRIECTGHALALELGIGVHDHARVEVFEPEVVLAVVAQVAHDRDGLLLRLLTTEALAFQALEVAQDAAGGLDHVAGFQRLGRVKVVMALLEHQAGENQQHQDGCQQNQPQTSANGNIAQAGHGQLREREGR